MIYLKGHLARPLDAVLSSASRLAVLRQLAQARGPLSGRKLATHAGVNHQTAALALQALGDMKLLRKTISGRSVLWSLDRKRWIVSKVLLPLFAAEGENADAVKDEIIRALRPHATAVLLGGAAAKGKLAAGEPLEMTVVIAHLKDREKVRAALADLSVSLEEERLIRLEPRVISAKAAEREPAVEMLWRLFPAEGPCPLAFSARA